MKKLLLSLSFAFSVTFATAQTASNFTTNDCSSISHDLFTELDAGKIIVITWVMPCGACISGGLAAQSAAQSFSTSNPGQVITYIADDYGNSTCATISSWCTTNGINPAAKFSATAVSMSPYGAAGMPKVIVLGGTSHTVYYNQNGSAATQPGIQNAISTAIAANVTTLKENSVSFSSLEIYPNPTNSSASLSLKLAKETKVKIEILNVLGQKVMDVNTGTLSEGNNTLNINTSELSNGNYFITCSNGNTTKTVKLIVVH